jgi:hypothetical protein
MLDGQCDNQILMPPDYASIRFAALQSLPKQLAVFIEPIEFG